MNEDNSNSSALRLLHVVESFGGGVFEMVRLLAERSVGAGHQVAIAYGQRPETPADVEACFEASVELHPTPWLQRSLTAQLRTRRQLTHLAEQWKPDVIHLHSSFAGAIGALALAGRQPTVYSPHGYSFEMRDHSTVRRTAYRLVEAVVARRVTLIGAVSSDEAELVRRKLHHRRVVVVQNGIPELDEPVTPRARGGADARRAVTMGRISPQRQPEACARILHELRDVAECSWIGGPAVDSPHACGLRLADIPITGWMPRNDALRELERAQLYLHWTAWDGQPLSVLEAMARDVVVVAHDIPPLRELLDPRQLCETEQQAVALIRRLFAEPAFKHELLHDQRTRARRFGTQRMVDGWHRVYRQLVAGHAPAAAPQPTGSWAYEARVSG